MFGRNIPIKPDRGDGSMLRIVAIWRTIQGEGPYAGRPAIFIRLAGCNLKCFYCDTDFETGARSLDVAQIASEVEALRQGTRIDLAVLTGGEPLAQNIAPLCRVLLRGLGEVQIETAGTVWPSDLSTVPVTIVCSPKTADVHPEVIRFCRDWKYIIRVGEGSPDDGLPIYSTQEEHRPLKLFRPRQGRHPLTIIWVQPCDEYRAVAPSLPDGFRERDTVRFARNMDECVRIATQHGYRISLQTHKLLGVE